MTSDVLNILLVEDDVADQKYIARLTKSLPINVTTAIDGKEAIKVCGTTKFDCVLLDYNLPGTETWTLLDYLIHRHYPVILVTGYKTPDIQLYARQIGATSVIDKLKLSTPLLYQSIKNATSKTQH